jgi:hypothetical protein
MRGNKKETFVPNLCFKSPKKKKKKKESIGVALITVLLTNENAPLYKFSIFLGGKMFSFFLDKRLIATFSFVKNQKLLLFTYQMLLLRANECVQLGYLQFTKCDNISGVK